MSLPDLPIPTDLVTSGKVQAALEDFIVEAIDEATDMLATGDLSTKTQLIKMVLAGALKARADGASGEAEEILAQARKTVAGLLDADDD